MINNKKVLAVIPARGGSKGVSRKNLRPLLGKPLIQWTIDEARLSRYLDQIIVSTDDMEIANVAITLGVNVPFLRPVELAQDDTPGIEVMLHAIRMVPGYEIVITLQPTSPLRTNRDIDSALEFFINQNVNACVSVTEPEKSPYWMYYVDEKDKQLKPIISSERVISNRQQLPPTYVLNGAIYIANTDWLVQSKSYITSETIGYIMDKDRSYDIDTIIDFKLVEYILEQTN